LVLDNKIYVIVDCIGTGGSSKIYKAKNGKNRYLIKELYPSELKLKLTRHSNGALYVSVNC
jgi:hypothetical protein